MPVIAVEVPEMPAQTLNNLSDPKIKKETAQSCHMWNKYHWDKIVVIVKFIATDKQYFFQIIILISTHIYIFNIY